MMYFLIFSPPATVLAASPARAAMSTKLILGAVGTEPWEVPPSSGCWAKVETASSKTSSERVVIEKRMRVLLIDVFPRILQIRAAHITVAYSTSSFDNETRLPLTFSLTASAEGGFRSTVGMRSRSLTARLLSSVLATRIVFSGMLCFAQTHGPAPDTASALELAKMIQQETATAELQVMLGGNPKDFSISNSTSSSSLNWGAQQNRVQTAAATFREALKTDPNNAELHFDLSLALAKLGEAQTAHQELESATRLDPSLSRARNHFGIWLMLNGEGAKAESEFRAAISADPQFVEAKNNLGVLYSRTGRSSEAVELFRQVLAERTKYTQAQVNLGLVLAGEGQYAEAGKEFRNALRISPNSVSAYSGLAMVVLKLGRGEEAIEILRKVAQLQPNSASAHLNLGIGLAGDGFDLPGALEQFSEAIRLDTESAAAHYNKGRALNDLNRLDEARAELATACRLQPDHPDALYLLAQLEKQLGNIQSSAKVLDHLVTLEPSNSQAQQLLGQNLVLLGKMDEAIHHLQIAVGANPDNADALYSLAQELSRMGHPEAKVYMERFQELKQRRELNDRVQNLGSYGLEAANVRDWPQAVAHFKEAIELCGQCASSADLHRNLGLIYILKGDVEGVKQELEMVLRIKPGDADALKALATLPNKNTSRE